MVESMMESLRNGMGSWHTRAKTIWELQQMGFTAGQLYDVALVTAHLQTAMVVASKVYDSLVLAQASSELLSALESNEMHVCSLYELRILSSKQRKAAAEYVVEKGLDTKGAEELARAIKQHERRAELREGFSPLPGDCLALMHYRAAKESSQADEKQSLAQRALENDMRIARLCNCHRKVANSPGSLEQHKHNTIGFIQHCLSGTKVYYSYVKVS
ncbi:hypothetical protein SELMODRAFT_441634 [Selaginella moellendorffii]|uniref:Uncharacterized protein n=1 Tax=Selaginella moellendorffii TaxID=88036 RepID=D8RLJ2_SELML|nr:hypothetical protein SELMODRAFT_441634 [Selaginella moellendorffii]